MASTRQYIAEHKSVLKLCAKHILPWLTILLSILAFLFDQGWLDKPAKERDVYAIAEKVESNKKRIDKVEDIVRGISVSTAVTAKELSSINKQIGSIERDIRQILNSLLSRKQ